MLEVRTQAELDRALRDYPNELIACVGNGTFDAYDSATVHASGSATVRAYDSATVHAYGSATVTASGSATVHAYGSATVTASKWVGVIRAADCRATVTGGHLLQLPSISTAAEWCEFHGIEVTDGVAVLFKAVGDDWCSANMTPAGKRISYKPGSKPKAPDWDGGKAECGGGLHFSPSPHQALGFNTEATRFVGCPVRVDEIVIHPDGMYPDKVKAPRCGPCFEVDLDGSPK